MKTSKKKTSKRIPTLDYMSSIGERVQFTDLVGKVYEGKLISMNDDFLATVELDNGETKLYQC